MDRKYPFIRIETIDKEQPPTSRNIRCFMDGEDISSSVTGIVASIHVGETSRVTLHLYANVEIDGLVLTN